MAVEKKQLENCESIVCQGAQILIHVDRDKTTIEIHTAPGWRMSKFCNPLFVNENIGTGGRIESNARTTLFYSKGAFTRDMTKIETKAEKRSNNER